MSEKRREIIICGFLSGNLYPGILVLETNEWKLVVEAWWLKKRREIIILRIFVRKSLSDNPRAGLFTSKSEDYGQTLTSTFGLQFNNKHMSMKDQERKVKANQFKNLVMLIIITTFME